jgi:hypothetical protein
MPRASSARSKSAVYSFNSLSVAQRASGAGDGPTNIFVRWPESSCRGKRCTACKKTARVGLMALIFFSSRNGFDEPPDVQSDGRTKR